MSISLSQVSFEHHREPLGIHETRPRISWRFEGNVANWEQQSYDLQVDRDDYGIPKLYNVESGESLYVPWPDQPLSSTEAAKVRVKAHGLPGQPTTEWSDWVTVETGLLDASDWGDAVPIAADRQTEINAPKRPVHFRKEFDIDGVVTSARLYITALGVYEAEINGRRVGDHVLAPGWQSYNYRHVYDTYDVTDLVGSGDNAIGVLVGEGWYAGRLGYGGGDRNIYGDTLGVQALLVTTTQNGKKHYVATDHYWRAATGPLITSEIYDGEKYDARLELDEGWSSPGLDAESWLAVKELPAVKGELVSADGPPVRRLEEVQPVSITTSPSGKTIIDFGQNLVGWLRLNVSGQAGTNITLHHAEVLEDGELSLEPLRNATAEDRLILADDGLKLWQPKFTFHGFRFAQIDGLNASLSSSNVTAMVVHSDMERTGWFECSNSLLNKFHQNVLWSMKGNFLSIPTDCPQRDERMGWTGDAHAFAPTADYLYDAAGFWRGWHKDIWSEQQRNGTMIPPSTIPVLPASEGTNGGNPTAVWGDVVVANPREYYLSFGDSGMLAEQYVSAQAWVDTGIARNEVGLWNRSTFQFGDWLDPTSPPDNPGDARTAKHLVADAYLIRMTEVLANISETLGRHNLTERYRSQHRDLLREFDAAWVTNNGSLANNTQTAYALAIDFGLLPEGEIAEAGTRLRQIIADNNHLVGTGFAGTPALGSALTKIGGVDDFYRMLLQTEVPSWLYQVAMNGTTTWERWNSLEPNGSVNAGTMTSFNHYAFGSVSDWIHTNIGGLSSAGPGWKHVVIAPSPGGNITYANSKHISPYGAIEVRWYFESGEDAIAAHRNGFHLEVQLPPNTKGTVSIPHGKGSDGSMLRDDVEIGSGYHEWLVAGYEKP